MDWDYGNLQALIPFVGGVWLLLMAQGILPRNPRDPAKAEKFRAIYGRLLYPLGAFLILMGVIQLAGVM